jgi:hypothetical protein
MQGVLSASRVREIALLGSGFHSALRIPQCIYASFVLMFATGMTTFKRLFATNSLTVA